jgi:hypothetical protein
MKKRKKLKVFLTDTKTYLGLLMKIRLIGHSKNSIMSVGVEGPWYQFQRTLKDLGHEISSENFGAGNNCLIANSHSRRAIAECDENKIPLNRRILILWEPKVVIPKMYKKKILSQYGKIYAPSVSWSEQVKGEKFNWPQLNLRSRSQDFKDWETRKNKAVMVLANKFSASRGEQYSLRRELNQLCEEKNEMDLFGSKWNEGYSYNIKHYVKSLLRTPIQDFDPRSAKLLLRMFSNFKGHSKDKIETTSGYTISIVIENSCDYISEKLFDSVCSGAITVYVGADLEKFGLKRDTVIQSGASAKDIAKIVRNLKSKSLDDQKKIAQTQYNSLIEVADKWEGNVVLTKLARDIHSYLKSTYNSNVA